MTDRQIEMRIVTDTGGVSADSVSAMVVLHL